jgi:hypothetical protein
MKRNKTQRTKGKRCPECHAWAFWKRGDVYLAEGFECDCGWFECTEAPGYTTAPEVTATDADPGL